MDAGRAGGLGELQGKGAEVCRGLEMLESGPMEEFISTKFHPRTDTQKSVARF
jgi:hypothetical protein